MTPLRRRMIEEFQIRHYAPGTQKSYLHCVPVRAALRSFTRHKMESGQQRRGWPHR